MATNPTSPASPFLLLFRNTGPESHQHLSREQREQLTKQWNDWYDGLAAQGKVQHGRPLGLEGRVVTGARGQRVTDGPYAEAKEVIGGYFFLTVADLDEATEIAKMCPGLPLGLTVEVRPVAEFSPILEGVRGRPPVPSSEISQRENPQTISTADDADFADKNRNGSSSAPSA